MSVKSVGHIADFSSLMMSRRPSSSSSELEMVMSAAVGVQHVRVGISRLIRRLITLLIHRRRRRHYSLVVLLVLLLWLVVIVAVR